MPLSTIASITYNADGSIADVDARLHPAAAGAFTCWSAATRGRELNHGQRGVGWGGD